jgi:hypothetical protein
MLGYYGIFEIFFKVQWHMPLFFIYLSLAYTIHIHTDNTHIPLPKSIYSSNLLYGLIRFSSDDQLSTIFCLLYISSGSKLSRRIYCLL